MPEPQIHSEPPPPPKPQPAPRAPGFGELFEQSLMAVYDPSVFRRAAARPAPSFGAAGGFALSTGVAALAVIAARAAVSSPELLGRFAPPVLAAFGAGALGAYACAVLLLAAALNGLGKGFGGGGDFERGLQAAAMISVLAPVQTMCNWFPFAWIAPALLAAWAAAGALEGLFNARPGPVRALCVLLAAGGIALQAAGRAFADRALGAYGAAQAVNEAAVENADLARSMSAIAQQAQAASAAASSAAAPPPTSSLDLLRGPSEDGRAVDAPRPLDGQAPAAAQAGPAPANAASVQAMQANAAGMLDALTPMLNMLQSSKSMGPRQKADMKELQGLMQELKTQMVSGKRMEDAVFKEKMSRYQTLLMKVMADSAPAASAAPAR